MLQFCGFSIRYPSLSNFKSLFVSIDGYGLPPKVTISYKSIPKAQLKQKHIYFFFILKFYLLTHHFELCIQSVSLIRGQAILLGASHFLFFCTSFFRIHHDLVYKYYIDLYSNNYHKKNLTQNQQF